MAANTYETPNVNKVGVLGYIANSLILVKQSLKQLSYLIDHYLGWFFTNGNKSRSVLDDGYWE